MRSASVPSGASAVVELLGVGLPRGEDLVERSRRPRRVGRPVGRAVEHEPQLGLAAAGHGDGVPQRRLRAEPLGVDGRCARDDVVADAVLRVRRRRLGAEDAGRVGVVLAEERLGCVAVGAGRRVEPVAGEVRVLGDDERRAVALEPRPLGSGVPGPRVAEPERRQHMEGRLVRPVVLEHDPHQHFGRVGLRVGDVDRPVAVAVEDARVEKLQLGILEPAAVVHELRVRERGLRIVVAPLEQRVARQALEVPPVLLDVFAVVPLRAGQPEHALLQDRVVPVPEREREAELVPDVRDAGHAVLVPAVRARAGVIVWEVVPGVTALGVVLADRSPCALAQVRAPLVPGVGVEEIVLGPAGRLGQARMLRGVELRHADQLPTGCRSNRCHPYGSSATNRPLRKSSPLRS